jgi:hypothetical protein
MDCPRCLLTFRAPQPGEGADVLDDVEVVDDYKDEDDVPTVEAVEENKPADPARPKRRPPPAYRLADGKPRFGRRRRRKPIRWVPLALAGVVVLAVIGGLVGLFAWLLSRAPGDDPLAFVPPDAHLVAGVRIGDLAREVPAVGQLLERQLLGPANAINFKENFGVEARDLYDQMTVALTADGTEFTVITKSSVPFDRWRVVGRPQKGMTKVSGFGQSYFRVDDPSMPFKTMYCPNKRLIVITALTDTKLKPILKSDGKTRTIPGPVGDLAARLSAHHAWAVSRPDGQRGPLTDNPGATAAPGLDNLSKTAQAIALWLSVANGTVDVHFGMSLADDAAAQQAVAKMQTEAPKLFALLEGAGFLRPALGRLATELKSSAKFTADGPLAEMSAQVSVGTLEALAPDLQRLAPKQP